MKQTITDLSAADLCQQLKLLLQAGVELGEGLYLLREQAGESSDREMFSRMADRVSMGEPLAAALAGEECFPHYFTALVEVGEQTGRTEQALEALSRYYSRRHDLITQVRSSLTYPAILLVLMCAVVFVLLTQVLPVFEEVYATLGGQLTGLAGGLSLLGHLLAGGLPLVWGVLCVMSVTAAGLYFHAGLRRKVFDLWRRYWGDRGVAKSFNDARFIQGLSMGMSSGLMVEEAVELGSGLVKDVPGAYRRARHCRELLERGESLSDSLFQCGLTSAAAARLLALGLRSGRADQVMERLAERMDGDARQALEEKIALIEPAMVLCTSVLVGAILLSVMLPLMNIMNAVG